MATNIREQMNQREGSSDAHPSVKIVRWRGGQHPTFQTISSVMEREGLRPYSTSHSPNSRFSGCSYSAAKVLYCVEGSLEVALPDLGQTTILRPGDRMELPRGVRHVGIVGVRGARCVESQKA